MAWLERNVKVVMDIADEGKDARLKDYSNKWVFVSFIGMPFFQNKLNFQLLENSMPALFLSAAVV